MIGAALLLAVCCLPALGAQKPAPPTPLPTVDTSAMEPGVRAQLDAARQALDAARSTKSPPAALAAAYGRCGELYALYHLNAAALAAFGEAARLAPREPRWAYLDGALLQLSASWAAADRELTRALTLAPGDGPSLLRRGQVRLELWRLAEARADFAAAAQLPGFAAAASAGLGRVSAAEGEDAQAVSHFEAALATQPEAGEVRYQLGQAYRRLGRKDEARTALSTPSSGAVRFPDPLLDEMAQQNAGSRLRVIAGTELLRAGRWSEAAEALKAAIAADPRAAGAWAGLGVAQGRLGHEKEAEASYRKAIEIEPSNDIALFNLGTLRLGQGRVAEAVEPLEAAARVNPSSKPILFNLGKALSDLGQPGRALVYLDRLIELAPQDLEARFQRATELLTLGRASDAIDDYGKVVAGAPSAAEPRYGRALALLAARRDREALQGLEADLEALPGSPLLAFLRIEILTGSYDPQVRDGKRAMALAQGRAGGGTSNPLDEAALALAYGELGSFTDAADHQRRALSLAETAGPALIPRLQRCLEAFEKGEACREPWK